jgi:hypothetical protein
MLIGLRSQGGSAESSSTARLSPLPIGRDSKHNAERLECGVRASEVDLENALKRKRVYAGPDCDTRASQKRPLFERAAHGRSANPIADCFRFI